jgi:hypothetical protein
MHLVLISPLRQSSAEPKTEGSAPTREGFWLGALCAGGERLTPGGLELIEAAPGIDIDRDILAT